MKSLLFLIATIFFSVYNCQAQLLPSPENTYVVIAGALKWEADLTEFSDKNRKDAELEQYFVKKGVPTANIVALYDNKATLSNMTAALKSIGEKATSKSTIVFYYAGHGIQEAGHIYFANYDIDLAQVQKKGFSTSLISDVLGKSKANRIVLLADCCYSGGLIKECKKLSKMEKKVVAMTSATASNVSTGNWTFTQTLLDCLNGNSIGDYNNDGAIQLEELRKELSQAMKCRERQMYGFANEGFDVKENVSDIKTSSSTSQSTEYGQYYWAKQGKEWLPVRIVGKNSAGLVCEFYFYSDKKQKTLSRKELRVMHFVEHSPNAAVKVEWKKKWYPAKVLKVQEGFSYIKYDGYDDSWNEWVLYDRVRTGKERRVEALDAGAYYPAYVLDQKDGKFYIHYEGYSDCWDEWVSENRIQ